MKATFKGTLDILVKAYLNNTLMHGSCYACAVGNIIGDKMCGGMVKTNSFRNGGVLWKGYNEIYYPGDGGWDGSKNFGWGAVFNTPNPGSSQYVNSENYKGKAKEQIDSTGYTWRQLAKIEKAFENAWRDRTGYVLDQPAYPAQPGR